MNIIICINQLSKGGAERVVANLSNYLCNNNEVTIISLDKKDIGYDINDKVDIKFIDNGKDNKLLKNVKRIIKLKKIYKKEKADVILTFLPESSFFTLMLKSSIKSKVIVSVRNDPKIEYKSIIYKILMKILYPRADGYVFQTEDAKNYFNKKIKSKSKVIFNSLNPEFIVEPYMGEREKTIVSVGRLSEQKNHELLIYAFNKIHKEYPEYKLIIYGEGHLRSKYEQLIKKLNLEKYITLPGVIEDIKSKIYKSGIFVLSSNYEGMPNVLMEALSMGIPCISTDCPCGGPKSLINDGENGILVEVQNENMLADKIKTIINDSTFAKKISLNNIEMRKKFNPKIINKEWEKYILNVIRGER